MGAVVVGLVDRPEGWAALTAGMGEAIRRGVALVIVCSGLSEDAVASMRTKVEATLSEDGEVRTLPSWEVRSISLGNSPVEDLISTVEQAAAEVLVIGLRKRSSVGKFLMGSDAQRILMQAQCPVLAVKE